jgi:hypothetical protein
MKSESVGNMRFKVQNMESEYSRLFSRKPDYMFRLKYAAMIGITAKIKWKISQLHGY